MFTKILYINLDRRQDRKENVINELNKVGINSNNFFIDRIPGIDWKTLDFNNLSNNLFTKQAIDTALDNTKPLYSPMTKGGIGCALAHRNAYKNVLEFYSDYVLILEDDITIENDFINKLKLYITDIPEFDILWLGYHQKTTKENYNKYIDIPDNVLFGLFGYIINKKAAFALTEIFPLTKQIDSEIPKIFSKLKVYALKEEYRLIHSMPSATDTKFGTDIQIREQFISLCNCNKYTKKTIINIIYILIIIIGLIYLFYDKINL